TSTTRRTNWCPDFPPTRISCSLPIRQANERFETDAEGAPVRLTRLRAVARKELIQIWRDPRSLFIALAMPVIQMALLGYGVSLDAKHIAVCAFDQEGSQKSQDLLKRFQASEYFDLKGTINNYDDLTAAIDSDRCKLGI